MTTSFDDLLPTLPEEVTLAARECWEACKGSKVGDWMSHIHHTRWLERLTEPVGNRIRCYLVDKDPAERVERLRRLRPFDTSKATPEWREALTTHDEVRFATDKALAAYCNTQTDETWDAYKKMRATYNNSLSLRDKVDLSPEMLAVHAQVCGCPWDKDRGIFG